MKRLVTYHLCKMISKVRAIVYWQYIYTFISKHILLRFIIRLTGILLLLPLVINYYDKMMMVTIIMMSRNKFYLTMSMSHWMGNEKTGFCLEKWSYSVTSIHPCRTSIQSMYIYHIIWSHAKTAWNCEQKWKSTIHTYHTLWIGILEIRPIFRGGWIKFGDIYL